MRKHPEGMASTYREVTDVIDCNIPAAHSEQTRKPSKGKNPRSISKRLRFEVFKRDDFTCQYCGAQPPKVVLEVDHIHPVAEGGTGDAENLITSCDKCNRGKGKRTLGDRIVRPDADVMWLKTQQEIAELKRYQKARARLDSLHEDVVRGFQVYWWEHIDDEEAPSQTVFMGWMRTFGPEEIQEALMIAAAAKRLPYSIHDKIKYVSGILWQRKRKQNGSD